MRCCHWMKPGFESLFAFYVFYFFPDLGESEEASYQEEGSFVVGTERGLCRMCRCAYSAVQ